MLRTFYAAVSQVSKLGEIEIGSPFGKEVRNDGSAKALVVGAGGLAAFSVCLMLLLAFEIRAPAGLVLSGRGGRRGKVSDSSKFGLSVTVRSRLYRRRSQ